MVSADPLDEQKGDGVGAGSVAFCQSEWIGRSPGSWVGFSVSAEETFDVLEAVRLVGLRDLIELAIFDHDEVGSERCGGRIT